MQGGCSMLKQNYSLLVKVNNKVSCFHFFLFHRNHLVSDTKTNNDSMMEEYALVLLQFFGEDYACLFPPI